MNKFFSLFLVAFLLAGALLPAAPVYAVTEQASADPVPAFQLTEPFWNCISLVGNAEECSIYPDSTPEMLISLSKPNITGGLKYTSMAIFEITCSTAYCPTLAYFVYADIFLSVNGGGANSYQLEVKLEKRVNNVWEDVFVDQIGCEDACTYQKSTAIKKAQLGEFANPNAPVRLRWAIDWKGTYGVFPAVKPDLNAEIKMSFIDVQCDERYTIVENIADYDIDETVEEPQGPDAEAPAVPDNMIAPILEDNLYRLETSGGPWRNGSYNKDMYMVEVSFDEGLNWTPLDRVETPCSTAKLPEPDLMVVYFVAPPGSTSMQIRVWDQGGNFADNTLVNELSPMHYRLDLAVAFTTSCSNTFTYDTEADLLISGTIPANDGAGVWVDIPFPHEIIDDSTGFPYNYPWIVIETGPQGWTEPPNMRWDAEGRWFSDNSNAFLIGQQEGQNQPPDGSYAECVEQIEGGGYRIYLQSPNDKMLNLVVNDQDANFANNTGALEYRIYYATYSRPRAECESTYELANDYISSTVSATAENGKKIADVVQPVDANFSAQEVAVGAWYALDTDAGPWIGPGNTHGKSLRMQISLGTAAGPLTWHDLEDWEDAACVVDLDNVGHIRVYFQVPLDLLGAGQTNARAYYLRVDDTDFSGNTGSMGYTLRRVDYVVDDPVDGECTNFGYDLSGPLAEVVIPATASNGVALVNSQFIPDNYYLLAIDGGPWYEGESSPPLYAVEVSTNNGGTWSPALTHPSVLCAEERQGDEVYLFVRPQVGEVWKFRVMSVSYADNIGNQHITVYPANPDGELTGSCLEGAELYEIGQLIIDPKREDGVIMNSINNYPLVAGEVYAFQIYEGSWMDNALLGPLSARYYNLDFSTDNGDTWQQLHEHDRIDCFRYISRPLLLGGKARFKMEIGDVLRMRVSNGNPDTDEDWTNNGGSVTIKIFAVTNAEDSDITDVPILVGVNDVCMEVAVRPASMLDLAGWTMYGFDTLRLYIAWCPRHNQAIRQIFTLFEQYEPFATIAAFSKFFKTAQQELNSYNWNNNDVAISQVNTSDQASRNAANQILSPRGGGNPWTNGVINIRDTNTSTFSTSCNSALKAYIGSQMADSYCFAGNMLKAVGVNRWFQVLVDMIALVALGIYIAMRIVKPGMT